MISTYHILVPLRLAVGWLEMAAGRVPTHYVHHHQSREINIARRKPAMFKLSLFGQARSIPIL